MSLEHDSGVAGACCLKWIAHNPEPFPSVREDGIAAIFVTILRFATQNTFAPVWVSLARPHPGDNADHYAAFFGCEVQFEAPATSLLFDAQLLDIPLVSADPDMARSYEQLTEQYIAKLEKADFPARVRNELIRLLPLSLIHI